MAEEQIISKKKKKKTMANDGEESAFIIFNNLDTKMVLSCMKCK